MKGNNPNTLGRERERGREREGEREREREREREKWERENDIGFEIGGGNIVIPSPMYNV